MVYERDEEPDVRAAERVRYATQPTRAPHDRVAFTPGERMACKVGLRNARRALAEAEARRRSR